MKRRHTITGKQTKAITERVHFHPAFPALLADSFEVLEECYQERIQILNDSLHQLNVLDNAKEIAFVCSEISIAKERLARVLQKKKLHLLKSR